MYEEAQDLTGLEYSTLSDYKYVCDNISLRKENLTFKHHYEVVKLIPEEQEELLTWAEENNASVRELRIEIKRRNKLPLLPLPANTYRIIYADPPWKYTETGISGFSNVKDIAT